jgi:Cu(I)/Ag(I) efflux system membrane fusion protein
MLTKQREAGIGNEQKTYGNSIVNKLPGAAMRILSPKSRFGVSRTIVILLVVLAFIVGVAVRAFWARPIPAVRNDHPHAGKAEPVEHAVWTCSMHPNVRQTKPGKCPICFMDLVPVSSEGGDIGERQISFSEAAIKLMEIETTPAERKFVTAEIRMVGKIDYDETRVKYITAWVPGRIDRLYVDYTGITVNKGDHMVYLYSPELLSAQAELLQALKAAENAKVASELIRTSTAATLDATREKLRLLGLTPEQIGDVEKTGKVVDHLTIYAPVGGVVIQKNATEQMYVKTGTRIYTIADLSQLWVKLDAYESDMMWVRYGQQVEFEAEAYPGESFEGKISFIDPVLDPRTRTVKLRVNVENPDGKLKPGMFVRAVVRAEVAQAGQVMDPAMAGKWVCPMHPDVVKAVSGACDICEMPLVTTESLGYVKVHAPNEAPLVIPASAPLITGKRAVVYVKVPQTKKPTYEGRKVILGPRAGDYYIVNSGLSEGEAVVTNGSFKIDSAMQIQAKPSMMSAPAGQTICPIMGGAINKDVFVEYKGKKVYFCCPGCESQFEKNPEKYLDKLPQFKEQ